MFRPGSAKSPGPGHSRCQQNLGLLRPLMTGMDQRTVGPQVHYLYPHGVQPGLPQGGVKLQLWVVPGTQPQDKADGASRINRIFYISRSVAQLCYGLSLDSRDHFLEPTPHLLKFQAVPQVFQPAA